MKKPAGNDSFAETLAMPRRRAAVNDHATAASAAKPKPRSKLVTWLMGGSGGHLIAIIATAIAIAATTVSYRTGKLLAYNDATAHLDTARRIVDSLTPGIVQVGSVWLPLLHLLEVPFVSITPLWHDGLAGSIVSGVSFVVLSVAIYRLVLDVTAKRTAAVAAVVIIVANPNLLYLQSTAMFEALLLALTSLAVYFLTRWSRTQSLHDLIMASFVTMLATLTRYDGWPFFLAATLLILVQGIWLKRRNSEGAPLLYLVLGGFGIVLWLLYNGLIFKDPLYFQRGPYSAAAQQSVLAGLHQLPTMHNLGLSALVYATTVAYNIGFIIAALAVVGILVFAYKNWNQPANWFPLLLLVPFPFNVLSLYLGQSVIWLPNLPPHLDTYFNARYGILMLPAAAFFGAYLALKHRWIAAVVVVLTFVQGALFFAPPSLRFFGQPAGLVTLHDTVSSVNDQTYKATAFMKQNYHGGLIFVSSASADSFIFRADLPMKTFITEGTGYYWTTSVKYPEHYATWAVMLANHTDNVGKVFNKPATLTHYHMVYQDATYQIWRHN